MADKEGAKGYPRLGLKLPQEREHLPFLDSGPHRTGKGIPQRHVGDDQSEQDISFTQAAAATTTASGSPPPTNSEHEHHPRVTSCKNPGEVPATDASTPPAFDEESQHRPLQPAQPAAQT